MENDTKTLKKELTVSMVTLTVLFGLLYILSLINVVKERTILATSLSPMAEHLIVVVIVLFSVANIIFELKKHG